MAKAKAEAMTSPAGAGQFTITVFEDISRADEVIELLLANGYMAVLSDGSF